MPTLTNDERETIITFDEAGPDAIIFTYNKAWQTHLENKLGLKPIRDNGYGGREYQVDKKRLRPPRAPVKISAERRAKMAEHLSRVRQKSPRISQG